MGEQMNRLAFVKVFDHPGITTEDLLQISALQDKVLCGPLGTFPSHFSLGGQSFTATTERWVMLYAPGLLPQAWLHMANALMNTGHIQRYYVMGQVEPLADARGALMRAGRIEEEARKAFGLLCNMDKCGMLNRDDQTIVEALRVALGIEEKG